MTQSIAQTVPVEILMHIFSYLDESNRSQAAATCKRWNTATHDYRMHKMRTRAFQLIRELFLPFPHIYRDVRVRLQEIVTKELQKNSAVCTQEVVSISAKTEYQWLMAMAINRANLTKPEEVDQLIAFANRFHDEEMRVKSELLKQIATAINIDTDQTVRALEIANMIPDNALKWRAYAEMAHFKSRHSRTEEATEILLCIPMVYLDHMIRETRSCTLHINSINIQLKTSIKERILRPLDESLIQVPLDRMVRVIYTLTVEEVTDLNKRADESDNQAIKDYFTRLYEVKPLYDRLALLKVEQAELPLTERKFSPERGNRFPLDPALSFYEEGLKGQKGEPIDSEEMIPLKYFRAGLIDEAYYIANMITNPHRRADAFNRLTTELISGCNANDDTAQLQQFRDLFVYLEKFPFADKVRDKCLSNFATGISHHAFATALAAESAHTIEDDVTRWDALARIVAHINDTSNQLARDIVGSFTEGALRYIYNKNDNGALHVNSVQRTMLQGAEA